MPGEPTEPKRLDFNAPILSARRHASFSNPEPSSGPVRPAGVVPFLWEHSPGRPKDFVAFHSVAAKLLESSNGSEEEASSTRGLAGSSDVTEPAGSFVTDPAVRDFLMGRFLLDARAIAAGSPQPTRSGHPAELNRDANPWPPDIRNVGVLQPLLPPPLPESPSESWLSRALPRNASLKSFGNQSQPRKRYLRKSSEELKWERDEKTSEVCHRRRRFGEVLRKPVSP